MTVTEGTGLLQYNDIFIFEVSGVMTAGAASGQGQDSSGTSFAFATSPVVFQSGAFLVGVVTSGCTCSIVNGPSFTLITAGQGGAVEYADPVSSPTTFPMTTTIDNGDWVESGLALQPAPAPPIPEYPFGLAMLAILMIIMYGLIKRTTAKKPN